VLLWLLAGAVAVGLASAGVRVVSRQLTGQTHPAPLSADEVRAEVAAAATSSTAGPTAPPGAGATTTTTTAPPTTTATTARSTPPSSTTTTTPPPVTRTYQLVGGSATVRFSASGVTVLVATPAPGFTAEVEDHDGAARVEFESEGHKSRLDAWWANGPQAETREDVEHEDD
jgi:hypothetical protein